MQIKNEELRNNILGSAEREFLIHGYHNGSMRAIAKRANTTTGNIYHYFSNKEAILDEIIGDLPQALKAALAIHETFANELIVDANICADELIAMHMPELFPIDLLLSPRFLIFLGKSDGTKYDDSRAWIIGLFNDHLKWHMNLQKDSILTETLLHGFLSSLLFIGTHTKNIEEGRRHLIEYIKQLSFGLLISHADKDRK